MEEPEEERKKSRAKKGCRCALLFLLDGLELIDLPSCDFFLSQARLVYLILSVAAGGSFTVRKDTEMVHGEVIRGS